MHCRNGKRCTVVQQGRGVWSNLDCCKKLVAAPGIKTRWRCPSAIPFMCRVPSISCDNDHCCVARPRDCVKYGGLLQSSMCPRRIDPPNCPLAGAVGRTTMTCRNGMECDIRIRTKEVIDDWNWNCCKKVGIHPTEKTRYRCPRDFPYMCADSNTAKCGFDYCCTDAVAGCDKYGGLLTPVPSCPKLLDKPNCPVNRKPNWMTCMNGGQCMVNNGRPDVGNWDWGCCGNVSPKTAKCKTRLKCPSNFPYMCADPDTPHCFFEYCCTATIAGCDPYGGLLTTCPVPCADTGAMKPVTGCDRKPCAENAVCIENRLGQAQCRCKNGFIGNPFKKCAKVTEFEITSADEVQIGDTMDITFHVVTDPPLSAPLPVAYLILNADVDVTDLAGHRNLLFEPGTQSITRQVKVEPRLGVSGQPSSFTAALMTKTKRIGVNGCQHTCAIVGKIQEDDSCCESSQCVINPDTGCRSCQCKVGFTGDPTEHCFPIKLPACTPSTVSEDCCNDASCVKNPNQGGHVCKCNPGFEGDGAEHCSPICNFNEKCGFTIDCTATGFSATCPQCVPSGTCQVATEVNSGKCDERGRCIVDCTATGFGAACIGCVPQASCHCAGETNSEGKCDHSGHCNRPKCTGPCCGSVCEPDAVCTPEDGGKCHCKPGWTSMQYNGMECVPCTSLDQTTCSTRVGDCEWTGTSCGTRGGSAGASGNGAIDCPTLDQTTCSERVSDCKWTGTSCESIQGSAGASGNGPKGCADLADADCGRRPRECEWANASCKMDKSFNSAEGAAATNSIAFVSALIVGLIILLCCVPLLCCFFLRRKKQKQAESAKTAEDTESAVGGTNIYICKPLVTRPRAVVPIRLHKTVMMRLRGRREGGKAHAAIVVIELTRRRGWDTICAIPTA
eukprot:GEMP01010017.1.p1 GENE.GEMP01010017.1~~GEMP01010017.1.p1  ORF type:complete len:896 (+),score=114.00 GEMP01010017.1:392-3079(+)